MADTLSKYHDKYSQVQMHIVTGDSRDLYRDLVKGDVDLGILRGDFPWHGRKILLATEPVCAIKGLQSKNKSFNEIPYIGRKTDLAFDRDISKWMRENHVEKANNESYVDNITTCVKMVENSSGWAVVPEICLDDFKGIKEPLKFKNGQVFERPTYLMFPETVVTLPQIRTFVQFVVQENHKEVPEWLTTL
ncbi:LysR family transcriptional regulator substrate-binding protein [Secundilactobacillus silagei]|uniref:LysR family transcriptional regulator substrate-binding protein n=1 Tax=Secundilactobacillus silagei TaxID=1293415 RepID=UPI000AD4B1D8|nr:LysR family transcriptional regulator substrate-binding protein [Secundilactobacillus silagei]